MKLWKSSRQNRRTCVTFLTHMTTQVEMFLVANRNILQINAFQLEAEIQKKHSWVTNLKQNIIRKLNIYIVSDFPSSVWNTDKNAWFHNKHFCGCLFNYHSDWHDNHQTPTSIIPLKPIVGFRLISKQSLFVLINPPPVRKCEHFDSIYMEYFICRYSLCWLTGCMKLAR